MASSPLLSHQEKQEIDVNYDTIERKSPNETIEKAAWLVEDAMKVFHSISFFLSFLVYCTLYSLLKSLFIYFIPIT